MNIPDQTAHDAVKAKMLEGGFVSAAEEFTQRWQYIHTDRYQRGMVARSWGVRL